MQPLRPREPLHPPRGREMGQGCCRCRPRRSRYSGIAIYVVYRGWCIVALDWRTVVLSCYRIFLSVSVFLSIFNFLWLCDTYNRRVYH
ncbi:hypothetical protein B0H19DRAFT_1117100 [Mycena capillaripes]|nr:hypothetical protein B0H19DRAFT_1117100 [Mycena capillaripes]